MTTSIIARVRRVLRSNSDRALVHAVDDVGHEYKIEIPLEAARDVRDGGDHVLMLAWSLHVLPPAFEPATAPAKPPTNAAEPTARPSPSSVDQQFMDLMNRGRTTSSTAVTAPSTTAAPVTASPSMDPRLEHELAARLGITGRPT